jgi:integrase
MAGHIRKRKRADGATTYQARIPSPANRRKDIVETFERKREAERWLCTTAGAINRGDFIDPRRGETRFSAIAEEWRDTWADLAPKTQVGYASILNRHVLPAFGTARVSSITPKDVQDFANLLATSHSPSTVRRVMDVLRNVLRVAVERRYISAAPCVGVRLARMGGARRVEISPLTHHEIRALVRGLPEHWRLPVLLDAYTGLRAGELWALRRRDVDALRGELSVNEAIKEVTAAAAVKVPAGQRITGSLITGPTKTSAERRISVPAFLRDLLAEHLARPLPGGDGPDAFIFTTAAGSAVRHNLFYKRVFAPVAAATFPGRALRFHDLRHTCAAWLIDAGAHPLQIKLRLGHKEIRTTMDTYGHLFPSAEPELADLLDAGYRTADQASGAVLA